MTTAVQTSCSRLVAAILLGAQLLLCWGTIMLPHSHRVGTVFASARPCSAPSSFAPSFSFVPVASPLNFIPTATLPFDAQRGLPCGLASTYPHARTNALLVASTSAIFVLPIEGANPNKLQLWAGNPTTAGSTDGPAAVATFDSIRAMVYALPNRTAAGGATGGPSILLIDQCRLRRITLLPTVVVTTPIGCALTTPTAITVDWYGNIYIADNAGRAVRVLTRTGSLRTLAGTAISATVGPAVDAVSWSDALFGGNIPSLAWADGATRTTLLIADAANCVIRAMPLQFNDTTVLPNLNRSAGVVHIFWTGNCSMVGAATMQSTTPSPTDGSNANASIAGMSNTSTTVPVTTSAPSPKIQLLAATSFVVDPWCPSRALMTTATRTGTKWSQCYIYSVTSSAANTNNVFGNATTAAVRFDPIVGDGRCVSAAAALPLSPTSVNRVLVPAGMVYDDSSKSAFGIAQDGIFRLRHVTMLQGSMTPTASRTVSMSRPSSSRTPSLGVILTTAVATPTTFVSSALPTPIVTTRLATTISTATMPTTTQMFIRTTTLVSDVATTNGTSVVSTMVSSVAASTTTLSKHNATPNVTTNILAVAPASIVVAAQQVGTAAQSSSVALAVVSPSAGLAAMRMSMFDFHCSDHKSNTPLAFFSSPLGIKLNFAPEDTGSSYRAGAALLNPVALIVATVLLAALSLVRFHLPAVLPSKFIKQTLVECAASVFAFRGFYLCLGVITFSTLESAAICVAQGSLWLQVAAVVAACVMVSLSAWIHRSLLTPKYCHVLFVTRSVDAAVSLGRPSQEPLLRVPDADRAEADSHVSAARCDERFVQSSIFRRHGDYINYYGGEVKSVDANSLMHVTTTSSYLSEEETAIELQRVVDGQMTQPVNSVQLPPRLELPPDGERLPVDVFGRFATWSHPASFVKLFGVVFGDYHPPRHYFGVIDFFSSSALAVCSGMVKSANMSLCAAGACMMAAVLILRFGVIAILRPYNLMLNVPLKLLSAGVELAAAIMQVLFVFNLSGDAAESNAPALILLALQCTVLVNEGIIALWKFLSEKKRSSGARQFERAVATVVQHSKPATRSADVEPGGVVSGPIAVPVASPLMPKQESADLLSACSNHDTAVANGGTTPPSGRGDRPSDGPVVSTPPAILGTRVARSAAVLGDVAEVPAVGFEAAAVMGTDWARHERIRSERALSTFGQDAEETAPILLKATKDSSMPSRPVQHVSSATFDEYDEGSGSFSDDDESVVWGVVAQARPRSVASRHDGAFSLRIDNPISARRSPPRPNEERRGYTAHSSALDDAENRRRREPVTHSASLLSLHALCPLPDAFQPGQPLRHDGPSALELAAWSPVANISLYRAPNRRRAR